MPRTYITKNVYFSESYVNLIMSAGNNSEVVVVPKNV